MKLACEGNFGIGGRGFGVYGLEKLKQLEPQNIEEVFG